MSALFDPGLQPERTGLAWQRTCLAFLAGSLAAMKVFPPLFGPWSLLLGVAGVLQSILMLFIVRQRYLRQHHALTKAAGQRPPADGFLPAALGSSTVVAGAASLALVLTIRH